MRMCLALAALLFSAPVLSAADEPVTVSGTPVQMKSFIGQDFSVYGWIQIKEDSGRYRLVYFVKSPIAGYPQVTPAVESYVASILQIATLAVQSGKLKLTFSNVTPYAPAPAIVLFGFGSFFWYSWK